MAISRAYRVVVVLSALLCNVKGQPQVQRSAEIFPSGASKVIRTEAHQLEQQGEHAQLLEDSEYEAQYPGNQQRAVAQQPQAAPADEKNANAYCGGPRFVSTCGFKALPQVSFMTAQGKQEHIRGLCVCTHPKGCIEPVCDAASCTNSVAAECADGNSCIKTGGDGWECWHPCSAVHQSAEYGTTNGAIVNHIRTMTQSCAAYGIVAPLPAGPAPGYGPAPAQGYSAAPGFAQPTEPPLDGGIDLTYQSSPIFGSQVSATKGGATSACANVALLVGAMGSIASTVL